MEHPELTSPTPAKQAQNRALGHVAALKELANEFPAGNRTPEDEAYMKNLYKEGRQLREKATDLQPTSKPVHFETRGGTLTSAEEHRELVAAGEIKPSSGPTQ